MKRDRTINKSIELLIWVWNKWVENNDLARMESVSLERRVKSAKKCERLQIYRRILISEIDKQFEIKFKK